MRILVADDSFAFRTAVQTSLTDWGYDVTEAADGEEAWAILRGPGAPHLALLDWMMPGMDGLELCQKVRAGDSSQRPYLILLTAKGSQEDVITGLDSGADEYLTKPIELPELRARVRAGERVVELQRSLARRVAELEEALSRVKQLQGLLPICSWCKKIRDDQNYWQQVEEYLSAHSDIQFTHGICPDCLDTVVKTSLDRLSAVPEQPPAGKGA